MVLPLMADTFELTSFGTLAGQPCDHVMHFLVSPSVTSEHVDDLNAALAAADSTSLNAHIIPEMPTVYTHTVSRSVYLGDLTHAPHEVSSGAAGTNVSAFVPATNCWTIRHKVAVRGRGRQGRTNFPGPQVSFLNPVDNFHLEPGAITALQGAWDAYLTGILSAFETAAPGYSATLIVASRTHGTFEVPYAHELDVVVNTHRRWGKRLSRHR